VVAGVCIGPCAVSVVLRWCCCVLLSLFVVCALVCGFSVVAKGFRTRRWWLALISLWHGIFPQRPFWFFAKIMWQCLCFCLCFIWPSVPVDMSPMLLCVPWSVAAPPNVGFGVRVRNASPCRVSQAFVRDYTVGRLFNQLFGWRLCCALFW
jgi:hypothetical protein